MSDPGESPVSGCRCADADTQGAIAPARGTFLQVNPSKSLMARALDFRPPGMPVCDTTPRILIADDQPDLLDALRLLLKGQGIDYDAVTSPEAALTALRS